MFDEDIDYKNWFDHRLNEVIEQIINTTDFPFDPDDPSVFDFWCEIHLAERCLYKAHKL